MDKSLTIFDLITSLAERLEYAEAHNDLKDYFDQRAGIMCQLFGCDFKRRSEELDEQGRQARSEERRLLKPGEPDLTFDAFCDTDSIAIINFLDRCLKLINSDMMPGGNWLAGRPPRIERDLQEKYHDVIRDREREMKDVYRGMISDLLTYLFPGVSKRTAPSEKLFEMGLPRERPDLMDYF